MIYPKPSNKELDVQNSTVGAAELPPKMYNTLNNNSHNNLFNNHHVFSFSPPSNSLAAISQVIPVTAERHWCWRSLSWHPWCIVAVPGPLRVG